MSYSVIKVSSDDTNIYILDNNNKMRHIWMKDPNMFIKTLHEPTLLIVSDDGVAVIESSEKNGDD